MSDGTARAVRRIVRLDPLLADQIAAGEVVERPASVAKELVENSLDAGARSILVEVEEGGVRLLRVRDDGTGIRADELPLALQRHATSKIASSDDLLGVLSMGFRGEALPSIASVARLSITSRTGDAPHAHRVHAEGGEAQLDLRPASHPPGTSVEVRDLFFNTPARRRFLRSAKTEFGRIEAVVRALALARPEVAFTLRSNGRQVWEVAAAGDPEHYARRTERLCGAAFVDRALAVQAADATMALGGWLGGAAALRRRGDLQYFFVNRRMVRDAVLGHAVRQAFGERLGRGFFPAFVLYLDLDPRAVDVNVHPAKHEVRFREARLVHDFVSRRLARVLDGEDQQESPETGGVPGAVGAPRWLGAAAQPGPAQVREQIERYRDLHGRASVGAGSASPAGYGDSARVAGSAAGPVIAGRWAVLAEDRALRLVDLRAVLEALLQAELCAGWRGQASVPRRPVLVPEAECVPGAVLDSVESNQERLATLGFELRRVGPDRLMVLEVPALLASGTVRGVLDRLVRALQEVGVPEDEEQAQAWSTVIARGVPLPRGAGELEELLQRAGSLDAHARVRVSRCLDAPALEALFTEQGRDRD